jgi:hypothetical protein
MDRPAEEAGVFRRYVLHRVAWAQIFGVGFNALSPSPGTTSRDGIQGTHPMEPAEARSLSLTVGISNAVVHRTAEYTGRGPTRARTTIDGNTIVCIMRDALTRPEKR